MAALAGDPDCNKATRSARLDALVRSLLQPTDLSTASTRKRRTGDERRSEPASLTKIVPAFHGVLYRYAIARGSFADFAMRLDDRNRWPDGPHFTSYEALDRYNENLARSISECLSHVLFSAFAGHARRPYKLAFKDLTKALQLVTQLAHLREDERRGHYFLPEPATRSEPRLVYRQACIRLLNDAHRCTEKPRLLLRDRALEPDVNDFLANSLGSYRDLRRACLTAAW